MSGNTTNFKSLPSFAKFGTLQIGYTATPWEITIEGVNKDVSADQTGDEILALLNQGNNVTLKSTCKEITKDFLKTVFGAAGLMSEFTDGVCDIDPGNNTTQALCTGAGGIWTPSASPVLGIGSAFNGVNINTLALPITLTPKDPAEVAWSFVGWKALAVPGSIKYSGAEENECEIELRLVADDTKPTAISKCYIGDPSMMPNYVVA